MAIRIFLAAVLMLFGSSALAQGPRYFGYYANNGRVAENADHTNITHIGIWTNDKAQATNSILAELQQARAHGVKAMVGVDAFVFRKNAGGGGCPFQFEPEASQNWNTLVTRLVQDGYIVPGNPGASTVAAFYPVDEPEDCGLADQGATAHPALAHAISTIKADWRTAAIPTAVISSERHGSTVQGIRLFDWAGMDCYGCGSSGSMSGSLMKNYSYLEAFTNFQNRLDLTRQRTILVPQAATGGMMSDYGSAHIPAVMYYDGFVPNQHAVMLMPFLWNHASTQGVGATPSLKTDYTRIGHLIRNNATFVSQSVPASMETGGSYNVSITLRNTGTTTWQAGSHYNLGTQNGRDNSTWGFNRRGLPVSVGPGQDVTIGFAVTAPSQDGQYNFQWQMVLDGVTWFGDLTPNVVVSVAGGGGYEEPPPGGGYCDPSTHICYEVP